MDTDVILNKAHHPSMQVSLVPAPLAIIVPPAAMASATSVEIIWYVRTNFADTHFRLSLHMIVWNLI